MKNILEPDDVVAQFDTLVRSNLWQTVLGEVIIPQAERARSTLFSSKNLEDVRAAQATLAAYLALVKRLYEKGNNPVPRDLLLLLGGAAPT